MPVVKWLITALVYTHSRPLNSTSSTEVLLFSSFISEGEEALLIDFAADSKFFITSFLFEFIYHSV